MEAIYTDKLDKQESSTIVRIIAEVGKKIGPSTKTDKLCFEAKFNEQVFNFNKKYKRVQSTLNINSIKV